MRGVSQSLYWIWGRIKALRYLFGEPPSITVEPTDDMDPTTAIAVEFVDPAFDPDPPPDPDPPRYYG